MKAGNTLRILIADDHEMVRRGLKAVLTERRDWEVCGEAANGREAVALAEQLAPDIVILDIAMPELNGLQAIARILKASPQTEVLILTMHESEQLLHEVIAAGAHGFVLKTDAGRVLVKAIEMLSRHQRYFTSSITGPILRSLEASAGDPDGAPGSAGLLSPREREVLQLIAEGKSNKDVGQYLGISVRTAETHRTKLMHKLGLRSASDITRYAIRNQIIQP